jgi:hypothetical protein
MFDGLFQDIGSYFSGNYALRASSSQSVGSGHSYYTNTTFFNEISGISGTIGMNEFSFLVMYYVSFEVAIIFYIFKNVYRIYLIYF